MLHVGPSGLEETPSDSHVVIGDGDDSEPDGERGGGGAAGLPPSLLPPPLKSGDAVSVGSSSSSSAAAALAGAGEKEERRLTEAELRDLLEASSSFGGADGRGLLAGGARTSMREEGSIVVPHIRLARGTATVDYHDVWEVRHLSLRRYPVQHEAATDGRQLLCAQADTADEKYMRRLGLALPKPQPPPTADVLLRR